MSERMTIGRRMNRRMAQADQQALTAGGAGLGFEMCGPPHWDRPSWEVFKAQYGHYPYSPFERPPDLENAPAWVKALCGGHLTPAER